MKQAPKREGKAPLTAVPPVKDVLPGRQLATSDGLAIELAVLEGTTTLVARVLPALRR